MPQHPSALNAILHRSSASLEVQGGSKHDWANELAHFRSHSILVALTVPLNFDLGLFHFFHQVRVSDHSSSISDLAASLIQASDNSNNRTLCHVR
jgi:hypothetical protein